MSRRGALGTLRRLYSSTSARLRATLLRPGLRVVHEEARASASASPSNFLGRARPVTLIAGGNNKKVPLLLISSYASMVAGEVHVRTWTAQNAEGVEEVHRLETQQTAMHELYRKYMNLVDLHNKLRQGVNSMADAWHTSSWIERHFAELLGFVEVNLFKTLQYFKPAQYSGMSHGLFRAHLAWALMTLGRADFPGAN